jgi:plastocyanin
METMTERTWTWRRVLWWAAVASAIQHVLVVVAAKEVIPPVLIIAALLALGAWLLSRPGRAGVILLLVAFVFVLLTNMMFAIHDAAEWRSFPGFALAVASFLTAFVGLYAAVVVLRGRDAPSEAARTTVLAMAAAFVVLVGVNVVGTATYDDPARGSTDVAIVAKGVKWNTTTLTAKAGKVTFYADNKDSVLHNFHVKDVGVFSMPASHAASGTFDLKAGTYDYVCDLHPEDMKGKLTVS